MKKVLIGLCCVLAVGVIAFVLVTNNQNGRIDTLNKDLAEMQTEVNSLKEQNDEAGKTIEGLNQQVSEIISTYTYKMGIINNDQRFSTAVGLFNSLVNSILLITVNAITLGGCKIEFKTGRPKWDMQTPKDVGNPALRGVSRLVEPVDVGETILFLVSREASALTGDSIRIDRGLMLV